MNVLGTARPRALRMVLDGMLMAGLVLLGLSMSTSVAGVNIAKALLLLVALCLAPSIWRLAPWKNPVMASGLVLLGYIALNTIWRNGLTVNAFHTINRYQELLLAPIFMALMTLAPKRRLFFHALIAGVLLLAAAHWLAWLVPNAGPLPSSRRIATGFLLAVCAFLLVAQSRTSSQPWLLRAMAVILALTVLFTVGSRTGYVVVLVLAGTGAWLYSPPRWRWLAALSVSGLVLALALSSKDAQVRLQETLAGTSSETSPTKDESTSTAIRVHMLHIAGDMLREHALTGVGFANYAGAYHDAVMARKARDPDLYARLPEIWTRTTNPHNEYLMQLLGGGVAALGLFLVWLLMTLRQAACFTGPRRAMLAVTCLAFAVGCIFNSLLLDFVEGHFYVGLLAWLMVDTERKKPDTP